ncbi:hypothetical protein ABT112_10410 [Streptomyces sp. NPDC002055]|uniref:hypothetical protein n=1 Tax=Streptomyces sp. NPDC002055 TaxID=3154534 RepID=UPI00331D7A46
MSTPRFTIHDSAADPLADIWFAVPAGFVEIPLDVLLAKSGSPEDSRLQGAVAPLLDALPDDVGRQRFIAQLAAGQQMLLALREVGTVHCSLGLHRDDFEDGDGDGRSLLSLFTLSWRETAWAPRAVTAARAVATDERHTQVEYLDLPCGPASLSETVRVALPDSGLPQQPLLQVHAHLPHPDGKRLAVLTLSTMAIVRRAEYHQLLRQIAEMVSFDDPLSGVTGGTGAEDGS